LQTIPKTNNRAYPPFSMLYPAAHAESPSLRGVRLWRTTRQAQSLCYSKFDACPEQIKPALNFVEWVEDPDVYFRLLPPLSLNFLLSTFYSLTADFGMLNSGVL
jgi:hypothetical protein